MASVWAANGEFGRYKALLELEYGARGTVQDTVYFWIMPWAKLLGMFGTLCLLGVLLAIVFHSWGMAQRGPKRKFAFSALTPLRRNDLIQDDVPDVEEQDQYVDGITEVAIPPPMRTKYSTVKESRTVTHETRELRSESQITHGGGRPTARHHASTSGHQVHLTHKEKYIEPNHIVTLGKKKI